MASSCTSLLQVFFAARGVQTVVQWCRAVSMPCPESRARSIGNVAMVHALNSPRWVVTPLSPQHTHTHHHHHHDHFNERTRRPRHSHATATPRHGHTTTTTTPRLHQCSAETQNTEAHSAQPRQYCVTAATARASLQPRLAGACLHKMVLSKLGLTQPA